MEGRHRMPTEFESCFGCITLQHIDLSRAVVVGVDANDDFPGACVKSALLGTLTLPYHSDTGPLECHFHELAHGMGFSSRNNVVIRSVLLQHEPHCLHVFFGVSPIPF